MEDHAELAISAKSARCAHLNDGAFQTAALRKNEAVSVKERLREHGFHFVALMRRRGAEGRDEAHVHGTARSRRRVER